MPEGHLKEWIPSGMIGNNKRAEKNKSEVEMEKSIIVKSKLNENN